MARVRAGQASGPELAADRVSGRSVAQGLRTVSSQDPSGSAAETRDRQMHLLPQRFLPALLLDALHEPL